MIVKIVSKRKKLHEQKVSSLFYFSKHILSKNKSEKQKSESYEPITFIASFYKRKKSTIS